MSLRRGPVHKRHREQLVMIAAVGVALRRRVELEMRDVADCSLALTSQLKIFKSVSLLFGELSANDQSYLIWKFCSWGSRIYSRPPYMYIPSFYHALLVQCRCQQLHKVLGGLSLLLPVNHRSVEVPKVMMRIDSWQVQQHVHSLSVGIIKSI